MSKLYEAVEAASAAYDMEGDRRRSHEQAIKAAIQAAVKVLLPDADPDVSNSDFEDTLGDGFNACLSEIRKRAEIEEGANLRVHHVSSGIVVEMPRGNRNQAHDRKTALEMIEWALQTGAYKS